MDEKKGFKAWLSERFPLSTFGYEVPPHANTFLFSLGGITMISVIVLIITGFILTQFYTPNPEAANQSIRIFMTQVKLGSLVRSIHVWAAEIAVISLILHLLRTLFYGSYKKPREINWLFGVVLFVIMMGLLFTGTVIKWDQEGYEALSHTVAIGKMLGGPFQTYLAPNDTSLLSKFFSLHTSILPLLLTVVLALHLFLIKMLKISPLPWEPKKDLTGKHTFFQHFYKLGGFFFVILGLLFALAVLFPASIGPLPLKGIESTRPLWVFMPIFSIENWIGIAGLIYGAAVVIILLLLVPLVDRAHTNKFKDRKGIVTIAALIVLLIAGLTVNAYVTKPKQHIGMDMGGGVVTPPKGSRSTLDQINNALNLVDQVKSAVANKDFKTAEDKTSALDETVDPLKDAIQAKNPDLINDLNVEAISDKLSESNPNATEINPLLDAMSNALNQAKTLFPANPSNSTVGQINSALTLVEQIKSAVDAKDFKTATDKTSALDETVDPLKDAIQAKNPDLIKDLNVEAISDKLSESNPNAAEIDPLLISMTHALNQAKSMFSTNVSDSNPLADSGSTTSKLTTAMGMVDLIKAAVKDNDMAKAQTLATNLDEGLDPLKDAIQVQNPDLVNQLATDSLLDLLKEANPDVPKINSTLDSMNQALAKAVKLF